MTLACSKFHQSSILLNSFLAVLLIDIISSNDFAEERDKAKKYYIHPGCKTTTLQLFISTPIEKKLGLLVKSHMFMLLRLSTDGGM
ncbi:hypothetical protein ACJX0J_028392, partial [Zea mays]